MSGFSSPKKAKSSISENKNKPRTSARRKKARVLSHKASNNVAIQTATLRNLQHVEIGKIQIEGARRPLNPERLRRLVKSIPKSPSGKMCLI